MIIADVNDEILFDDFQVFCFHSDRIMSDSTPVGHIQESPSSFTHLNRFRSDVLFCDIKCRPAIH